jgi:hypothetical protein
MISKHVPPISGLTGLVTCCTIDGIWNFAIGSNFHRHKIQGFIFEIKENSLVGL